jgi:HEAT repeat protein
MTGNHPDDERIRAVIRNLVNEDGKIRQKAWNALHELGGIATEAVIQAAREPGEFRKLFVMDGNSLIHCIADANAVEPLISALTDDDKHIREFAACALAATKDPRAFDPLMAALGDETIRKTVIFALGRLGDPCAYDPLIAALVDMDPRVRGSVATALGRIGDLRAVDDLIGMLRDSDDWPRQLAAKALGRLGDVRALEPLHNAANSDDSSHVRQEAARALTKLGSIQGQDH